MHKSLFILTTGTLLLFSGCGNSEKIEYPNSNEAQSFVPLQEKTPNNMNNTIDLPENFSNMNADTFEKLMHSEEYITIDIRTPGEISQGKILTDSLEMDFYSESFPAELNALDKTKKYLIYCRSASRTGNTLVGMKQMGFSEVYDLEGGISDWTRTGKKLDQ